MGAVSASPLSEQVEEERGCPHPDAWMLECGELPQLLWESAAGVGLESAVSGVWLG